MIDLKIANVDLAEYIWNDENVNVSASILIDRAVVALDPRAGFHRGGPGHTSGIFWGFYVTKKGAPTPRSRSEFSIEKDEKWEIAMSYRGPYITALSYHGEHRPEDRSDQFTMISDKTTSPALVTMVKKLAEDLRLTYLDAHELMSLEISWDELQNNAEMRLDYSEPNAFNLLFYE